MSRGENFMLAARDNQHQTQIQHQTLSISASNPNSTPNEEHHCTKTQIQVRPSSAKSVHLCSPPSMEELDLHSGGTDPCFHQHM
ncbi:hypothetical protein Ddye_015836 [Dipteronia dyeriana]|uniref:Uncharacterized protein n=1 Tax=Dipteronia dyeriana TaxID=168575 RepID=A0AAD9WZP1_9ROSI|nr:hypothetical protein Ddye_015836 [Dipteronia dyeriana]